MAELRRLAEAGRAEGAAPLPGIGLKPLLSIQKHWRFGVWAALAGLLLGLPVVFIKGESFYRAEGAFMVSPTYMRTLELDKELEFQSNSQYREYVNHLSNTVLRYDVVERALALLEAQGITLKPEGWTQRRFVEHLQRTVYVRPIADTYMVRVGRENASPIHLDALVNALLDSFLQTTRAEQIYGSTERLEALRVSAQAIEAEIAEFMEQRVTLADSLGLTTFGENTQNPFDVMLFQAREKAALARIERVAAAAAVAAFDANGEVPSDFGRSLLEMRLQDNGLQALRNEIVKRSEELGRVLSGLREEHPAAAPARRELNALEARLAARERAFDEEVRANFRSRLSTTLAMKAQVERDTTAMLSELESRASEFAREFQKAMRLTAEIDKREAELDQVRDRLGFLDTESDALGFVRIVTRALPAEVPLGIGKTKLLALLLVVAFGVALAIPVVIDLLDPRIQSVNDAERIMGIPSAGWQIAHEDLATRVFAEEQAKRFASTLVRSKGRSGRNLFAFTSAKSGGGCTTTVLDLAQALRCLGHRVLVVEGNAFAPDARLRGEGPGIWELLEGEAEPVELPRPLTLEHAEIAVVGMGQRSVPGLQRLDLFKSALEGWSNEYEFVLVDLPPLLQSADAELLIEVVGQVFLIVEAQSVVKGELARARRLMERLDPDAVGLFVNRLPVFRGSGYMESLVLETLTRTRYDDVMRWSRWRLEWEILKTRIVLRLRSLGRGSGR